MPRVFPSGGGGGVLAAGIDSHITVIQIGVTGGQPVPQSTMKKLLTHLPNMKVVQLYGMTEVVNSLYQVLGKDTIDRVPYGAMEVNLHLEVQVTDEGGAVLPTGWTGEVWYLYLACV